MTYAAIDVDGTLTHSNVSFAFGRFLYRQGEISLLQALMPAVFYAAHALGFLSTERLHQMIFRRLFRGRQKAQIDRAVDVFFDRHGQQLLRDSIKEETALLQQRGVRCALLSSSPDFLVEKIARMVAIQEWTATTYTVDGRGGFSSVGRVVTGEVKAQIVEDIKRRDGLSILALTDSILDLPLLEAADQVVVVCPDRALQKIARQRGWRVIHDG